MPQRRVTLHNARGHLGCFVGRVVQHLNLELFARILHRAHGLNQPVDDKLLIEDRQLHRHQRQIVKVHRRVRVVVFAVLVVDVAECVAVHAIEGEHNHYCEVGKQQRQVEPVPVVEPFEGLVRVLHLQVVAKPILRNQRQPGSRVPRKPAQQASRRTHAVSERGDQISLPRRNTAHCKRCGVLRRDRCHSSCTRRT